MKGWLRFVVRLVMAWVALDPAVAFAEVKPHTVKVTVKAESQPYCTALAESLRFHFKSRQRLLLAEGPSSDHTIELACGKEYVDASWTSRIPEGTDWVQSPTATFRLAVSGDLGSNHASVALALTQQLFEKLPWDGEINAFVKPRKVKGRRQFIGPADKGSVHTNASVAAGYIQSLAATSCSPFEIGILKKGSEGTEFDVIGEGAFTSVGTFASPAEVYLDRKVPAGAVVVFRMVLVADSRREVRQLVARCKKTIGTGDGHSMARLVGNANLGQTISKEQVEINMVQQRAGAFAAQFAATDGTKAPFSVIGYAHSRADIGEYFAVDARAMRSVIAKPYESRFEAGNPQLTMAESFAMFRYDWDDISLTFGPGLFLSKINVPFEREKTEPTTEDANQAEPKPSIRAATAYPSLALGLRTEIGGFIADSQLSGAFGKKNRYLSFDAALNYKLTDTWFIGGDLLYFQFSEDEAGAPGGRVLGAGGHIGFVLKRTKQAPRHK